MELSFISPINRRASGISNITSTRITPRVSPDTLRRSSVANPMMPRIEITSPEAFSRKNSKKCHLDEKTPDGELLYKSKSAACLRRRLSLTPNAASWSKQAQSRKVFYNRPYEFSSS